MHVRHGPVRSQPLQGVTSNSLGWRHALALAIVLLAHSGTASAQQSAQSSDFTRSKTPASTPLSDFDRKLDCRGLKSAVTDLVDQMKRLQVAALKENNAPAQTLARLYARSSDVPGAGLEAIEDYRPLRARAEALAGLAATKGCDRIDVAALMRTAAAPARAQQDRCRVRTDFALEDCVEDIAQWRCRALAGKGRAYLECLDKVAVSVIAASGFERTRLIHFDPGCNDKAYKPDTCSVFSNDRNGPGKQWCKRVDESAIEVCEISTGKAAAGAGFAPAFPKAIDLANPPRAKRDSPVGGIFTNPKAAGANTDPPKAGEKINCRKVQCNLGTCNRLCAPPV